MDEEKLELKLAAAKARLTDETEFRGHLSEEEHLAQRQEDLELERRATELFVRNAFRRQRGLAELSDQDIIDEKEQMDAQDRWKAKKKK